MSINERNAEIARRRLAGERPTDLAKEFEVSPERIWQIVQAEQRRQSGEPPKKRSRDAARQAAKIRPRLRPLDGRMDGRWSCACDVLDKQGNTPKAAYDQWLHAAILAATPQAQVSEESSENGCLRVVSAVSRLIAPAATLASRPALTPVHASQVQVLPGAAARKPLSFASRLGLNLERIDRAQPRVHSLAGATTPRNGGFHDQE